MAQSVTRGSPLLSVAGVTLAGDEPPHHVPVLPRLCACLPERFDVLTQQAPQLELAVLERLAAGAYAQMDAAVRASAVRGGGYRPVSPVPRDISEASTVASATEEVRRAP